MNVPWKTILWSQFELIEMEEDDLPERVYTKYELQAYLEYGRKRCEATIEALTDEIAQRRCRFAWGEVSFAELLLYNLRHVQEIAAQLSLFLGQNGVSVPDFVPTARHTAAQQSMQRTGDSPAKIALSWLQHFFYSRAFISSRPRPPLTPVVRRTSKIVQLWRKEHHYEQKIIHISHYSRLHNVSL